MATWTYDIVTPAPIENALVERGYADGVHKIYRISAIDGYVLHDNRNCRTETDEMTGEEVIVHAYFGGTCTCAASYDFMANPYEFEAVLENSVPTDQIFSGGNNDNHETI